MMRNWISMWLWGRILIVLDAWLKFLTDLSGTRTLVVLSLVYLLIRAFLKGLALARNTQDIVALLGAVSNIFYAALLMWLGGKVAANGKAVAAWQSLTARFGSSDDSQALPEEEPWQTADQ